MKPIKGVRGKPEVSRKEAERVREEAKKRGNQGR